MRIRRLEFVLMFAVVLVLNVLFTSWWLAGNAFTSAWASRLLQTGGAAGVNAIANTFSYQGTLRNANGSLANGNFKIRLRIYNQPTGGSTLHDETFNTVVVRDGLFTVVVGDGGTPIGATVFSNAQLYLGITVNTDSELTPRQRIHPVPWAMQASTALSAVTAGNLAPGGGVPGSVTLGAGGAKEIAFPDGGKITDSATGLTISGGGANKAVTVGGDLTVNGNWNATAIRERGNGKTGVITETLTYPVSLKRYVLEASDAGPGPNTVPVNNDLLLQFCQDEDGCSVTLSMRDWNAILPGALASVGPYHLSLATPANNKRGWDIRSQEGLATGGFDNDGTVAHLMIAGNACYLTDGEYTNATGSDGAFGFGLLNWFGAFDDPKMTCVLVIED